MANGKVTEFPGLGAARVATVGQRMCPIMSKAMVVQDGPALQPRTGTITVACAESACRLWEFCSGKWAERITDAVKSIADILSTPQK